MITSSDGNEHVGSTCIQNLLNIWTGAELIE